MLINSLQGQDPLQLERNSTEEKNSGNFQQSLEEALQKKDDEKLKEACQQMEAIFIRQMLRQMRATVPQGGLLQETAASRVYRDMLDDEYSKLMASSRQSIGLAGMLYRQLKREEEGVSPSREE